jgi:eukaryotic-like serine/threonine-protein kinase
MTQDAFLLDFIGRSQILCETDTAALHSWATELATAGKSPIQELIVQDILANSSIRTLDLIRKGFLMETGAGVLFAPDGLAKLLQLLQPASENFRTRELPIEAIQANAKATLSDIAQTTKFQPGRHTLADITINGPTPKVANTANLSEPIVLQAGAVLGKCLLTGQIGKGGYGVVYSALHQTLGIPVAIKVLLSGSDVPDPEHVRQLRMEAQLLARLNHPNIIRVLDFDDTPLPYVVMEHVEGPSLADLITTTGSIWCQRACGIFAQTVLGLKAAWDVGIVHRDIKPGNILLNKAGEAKIADLGLAMSPFHSSLKSASNSPIGTCVYMAPEQARTAHDVDFRADIYSLGATFYHAVTGQLPFTARSAREMLMKHQFDVLTPANVRAPQLVDAETANLIGRMMAKEPSQRPASYDALHAELSDLANRHTTQDASDPSVEAAVRELESSGNELTETRKRTLLQRIFQIGGDQR